MVCSVLCSAFWCTGLLTTKGCLTRFHSFEQCYAILVFHMAGRLMHLFPGFTTRRPFGNPVAFFFPGEMGRRYTGNLAVESRWRFNSQKCRSVIGDSLRNLSKLEAWVGPAWLENLESAQTQNIWAQVCSRMPETFWPCLVWEVPVSAQEIPDYLSPRPRWLKICRHFGSQNFLSSSFAEIKNYCIFCRVLWQRQWFL